MKYTIISETKAKSVNSFEKVLEWIHANCIDEEKVRVMELSTQKVIFNFVLNANFGPSNRYGVDKLGKNK